MKRGAKIGERENMHGVADSERSEKDGKEVEEEK